MIEKSNHFEKKNIQLGIIIASNNATRLKNFLNQIIRLSTNEELKNIHILINLSMDKNLIRSIAKYTDKLNIKYINNEYNYTELHKGYNLLYQIFGQQIDFFCVLSDKFRFNLKNFSSFIINQIDNHTHIIRLSSHKNFDNNTLSACWHYCENWGFYSRDWLDAMHGWGNFWCPDATQEFQLFFCKKLLGKPLSKLSFVKIIEIPYSLKNRLNVNHDQLHFRYLIGEYFFQTRFLNKNLLEPIKINSISFLKGKNYLIKNDIEINRIFIIKEKIISLLSIHSLYASVLIKLTCLSKRNRIILILFLLAPLAASKILHKLIKLFRNPAKLIKNKVNLIWNSINQIEKAITKI